MIIYLVVIMSLNGNDFERRKEQENIDLCWENARSTMQQLSTQHEEMEVIGVGCVKEKKGNPA